LKNLKKFLDERTERSLRGKMHFKEYQDVIRNIDWALLQKQKKTLEKLLTNLPSHPNNIVHFERM
jgi:uncharacterized protein YggL (DUF469 family)